MIPSFSVRIPLSKVGPIAQSVEQRTFNPWVDGSSPSGPTINMFTFLFCSCRFSWASDDQRIELCLPYQIHKSLVVTFNLDVFYQRGPEMNESSWSKYQSDLSGALFGVSLPNIESALAIFREIADTDRTIWVIGNGGSAATASHFCVDLSKGCATRIQKTIRALPLMDLVPIQSAWSNDESYVMALELSLRNFARVGDILFVISGSGNSVNVLNALKAAKELGVYTIGLTGFGGGQVSNLVDLEINAPSTDMQIIEDAHHAICHYISRQI